ncbi:MAG: error-prone DNA polymerase [Ardenticatenales bacterium]|nr:error-prone DNA polymerase [Ardenticatenales bacterium]
MYIELHAHSNYSFLDGASPPEALAARAAALGMPALALTDHQGLYGAVKFRNACRDVGIKAIYGAEITVAPWAGSARRGDAEGDGAGWASRARHASPLHGGASGEGRLPDDGGSLPGGHLTLLVENAVGWASLCRLLSAAGRVGAKRDRPVTWPMLAAQAEGLICLTGCRDGVLAAAARRGDKDTTLRAARALCAVFGEGALYVELQRHREAGDVRRNATLLALAEHIRRPVICTNNVHYAAPDGFRLQHVLSCVREHVALDGAGAMLYASAQRWLKAPDEMADLFRDRPDAVANTLRVAERCDFTPDHTAFRLPTFPTPGGVAAPDHLRTLCAVGLAARYAGDAAAAEAQLAKELAVINRNGLADYFLVVHDIVREARARGILCQGRGSAAGSITAYTLGITPVDPLAHGLLFERFLADGQTSTPDIDVDFAADRREEVIQYVYAKYGAERTAMVANVITFGARSAVADVGRALGFPAELLTKVRRHLHTRQASDVGIDLAEVETFRAHLDHLPWRLLVETCRALDGYPRHLGIHVGGMIVTASPLDALVPLEPASMAGRVVVQWDKDDVEDVGLIKIDVLGLRTLGLVAECVRAVAPLPPPEPHRTYGAAGTPPDRLGEEKDQGWGGENLAAFLDAIPDDDPATWEMLRSADAIGCFQVESRAQLALLPRLRPERIEDLIIEVALIRPGPVQGGMSKAYLRRRDGSEDVSYWHPSLEGVLKETLGILVFQEQVLQVAMVVAGFSGAEADGLRRSMSRKRSRQAMERWRAQFVAGAEGRGIAAQVADTIFDHLLGFASYGFCKSHAAAFARLTWVTAWLKCHHPLEYACSLLNAQPMGFYTVEAVIEDAKRHGMAVWALDVNRSGVRWAVEGSPPPESREGSASAANRGRGPAAPHDAAGLRVPLARLRGMPDAVAHRIVQARDDGGPFASLWDFVQRVRPPRDVTERLVQAGACDGWGVERRELLWALGDMRWDPAELAIEPNVRHIGLPQTTHMEAVIADYKLLGLAQGAHILSVLRPALADAGCVPCSALADGIHGAPIRIGGRLEVLQRPQTAKGIVFVTIEDETGFANLVLYTDVFEAHRHVFRRSPVVLASGRVQQDGGVAHLIVERVEAVVWGEDGAPA